MKRWTVSIMPIAEQQLTLISDRRLRESLRVRLKRLEVEPEKQGKPLHEELTGYRSVRAAGQRYRIIYRLEEDRVLVLVVTAGIRKEGDKNDAYAQAIKLARLGLLGLE